MGGEQKVAQHRAMSGWFAQQKMNTVSRVAVPQQKSLDLGHLDCKCLSGRRGLRHTQWLTVCVDVDINSASYVFS